MNPFAPTKAVVPKTPFAATPLGIGVNTVLGIPKATAQVTKDIGQGIARSVASTGLTLAKPLGGRNSLASSDIQSPFGRELYKNFFGTEPVKPIEDRIAQAELAIKASPFAQKLGLDKAALPLAFGGVFGGTVLDLTPFGSLEKNATKVLAEETSPRVITGVLRTMKVPEEIIKEFAPHFADTRTVQETQDVFDTMKGVIGVKTRAEKQTIQALAPEEIKSLGSLDRPDYIEYLKPKLEELPVPKSHEAIIVFGGEGKAGQRVSITLDNALMQGANAKTRVLIVPKSVLTTTGDVLKDVSGERMLAQDILSQVSSHARSGTAGVSEYIRQIRIQGNKGMIKNPFFREPKAPETLPHPKEVPVSESSVKDTIPKDLEPLATEARKYKSAEEFASEMLSKNPLPETAGQLRAREVSTRMSELQQVFLGSKWNKFSPEHQKALNDEFISLQKEAKTIDGNDTLSHLLGNDYNLDSSTKKLTDFHNKVTSSESKAATRTVEQPPKGAESATSKADQALSEVPATLQKEVSPLLDIVQRSTTDVKKKINLLDYLRTPDRVLEKIGFGAEAKQLREGYEAYLKELPTNIEKITVWYKEVPKDASKTIFQYLDGKEVALTDTERKVAGEIKAWLADWAKRLNLPADKTITNYITHIFDKELLAKEFDEDLAKIITDKIPGSVYDPFLLRRLGAKGYKENVFEALDAYVKRATRKVNLDPALEAIQAKAGTSLEMSNIEVSQFKFIQKYISGVNMRPTDLDNLLDNTIKSVVGYKYGQRPVTYLTSLLRRMTYRGMLGLNPGSALRNISQGINTYAVLGEKYTAIGYLKLFSSDARAELAQEGILASGFIQDRTLSSTKKAMERLDKGLFAFFEAAERINRGSAYFGAKSKALAQGKSLSEAIDYAKSVVRKTQFSFGSIDTPVALQSDIVKTLAQFQNYTLKQTEFLAEMVKDKNFVGLLRYAVGGIAFIYTIGKAFGMEPKDLIPSFRFDTPPSLKLPVEVGKAALNTPDKFNQPRSIGQKAKDIGNSAIGLIPAGSQIKKSVQGLQAYSAGKDVTATGKTRYTIPHSPTSAAQSILFGKSSLPQAKQYYSGVGKKKTKSSATNPF